jgi:hypothetical protein
LNVLLSCSPFTTNNNIYHGVIRIIAAVMRTETPDSALNEALGLEIIDKLMPASSSWGSSSTNAASNSGNAGTGDSAAPGFIAIAHANIPGEIIQTFGLECLLLLWCV